MATHSSVLAWRIPGTGELGGLPSLGPHRVGHDWSDLAAAAAMKIQDDKYIFLSRSQRGALCFLKAFVTFFFFLGVLMISVWKPQLMCSLQNGLFYFYFIYFIYLFFLVFKFFFFFFYLTTFYWFCHTSTCICHGCTHVRHPEPLSHLPPHTIPLGHPSAPAPSFLKPLF